MRALTLTQPWATLIAVGAKRIETRSWSTFYRGPLAIHAAKGLGPVGGKRGLVEQCNVPAVQWALQTYPPPPYYSNHGRSPFPLGAIVATAFLVDVRCTSMKLRAEVLAQTKTPNEIEFGDYSSGRYAWFLENVKALLEPIPCKGALSLWEVPLNLLEQLKENR